MPAPYYPFSRSTRRSSVVIGDGLTTVWGPSSFKVTDIADVQVWRRDADADKFSIDADATVTKTGSGNSTFTVTFDTAPPASTQFFYQGLRIHERSVGITKGNQLDREALDLELTKMGQILQEVDRDLGDAIKVQPGVTPLTVIEEIAVGNLPVIGAGSTILDSHLGPQDFLDAATNMDRAEAARDVAELYAAAVLARFKPLQFLDKVPSPQHAAILDGSSNYDCTQAFIDLMAEAGGQTINFLPGRYNIDYAGNRTVPAEGLRLNGNGATLRATSTTNYLLLLDGAFGTHYGVSSITEDSAYVYDEAADASTVSVLGIASTPAEIGPGDLVKVYSTDEIENARPGTGGTARRKGEFATVAVKSGSNLTLTAKLKDTYTTAVKVVKILDRPFEMTGFILDQTDAAFASTAFQGLIRTRGLYRPGVDVAIRRARGPGVQFMGAYQPKAHVVGGNLNGNTVNGQYGYLIEDVACEGGRYSFAAHFCRHGITTNTYDVLDSVSADLLAIYCGKTRQALVEGAVGFSMFNSPFDVHEESDGVHFRNCHSRNTIEGRESQGSGYNFRSQNCTTEGCTSENDNIGVTVHETIAGSTAGGAVTLRGMDVRNARKKALQAVTFGSGTRVSGVRIEGGHWHAIEGPALDLSDADVETFGGTFRSDTGAVVSAINGTNLKMTDPQGLAENGSCVDWDGTSSFEHIRGEFKGGQTGQIFTSSAGAIYKNSGRPHFVLLGDADSAAIYRVAQGQTVKWLDGAHIDLSAFTGDNPRTFRAAGTGAVIKARGVIIERGAASSPVLFDGASVTGHSVSIEAAIDGNAPASGFGDYGTTNLHASVVPRIKLRADDKNTELITVPFTSAAQTPTLTFGFNAESEFTLYCTLDCDDEEDPEAFVMPDWPDGLEGQRMNVIVNPTGAGNTLAMTHAGTTNRLNKDGATVTLTGDDYEGARYIFTNGNWRQI